MRFNKKMKLLRYKIEDLIVRFGLWFFLKLKPKTASNLAARIAKFIGKKISVNKLAYDNISKAMPNLDEAQKLEIIDQMWDNLGRVVGEYGHIVNFKDDELKEYYEMIGDTKESFEVMKNSKKGGIIFGAHLGNWEIGPKIFLQNGLNVSTVYRPLNNPYVEKLTANLRGVKLIGKSAKGNRKILEEIKNGGYVVILADQKVSEGKAIKFFHDDAITTTSIARIALKYDIPLYGARSIRQGSNFKFSVELTKPLKFDKTQDNEEDINNLTLKINQQLEEWIKQKPSQWFWVHNRWKK